ncbi:transcriptional regulator, LacI family [Butyrivibrio sp. ob235]|uniref:LacI family DNA-binding transcriptional regulator n=1 Tax=Butyrivibrio sp. ob235 TaxID=1761780 RepID=UPI0008AC8D8D|nr:LacI family DNA-binding transcriptional regulator [Butyrivibrio sp. ob235]SEM21765.1 transcriptional regulator, LacI family [Butyrivibrio sp. ob235]
MTATIKDIAKAVGVNPSTVSRVINGTASISEETKEKINQAMKDLDYHPNSLARSLVNGSTFTIGLVIDAGNKDAFSNAFFIQSVIAIETAAQARGFSVLITNHSFSDSNNIKNLVQERKVDGIILPVQCMTDELVDLMIGNKFPFVVMGEPQENKDKITWVDVNNEEGSREAVECLIRSSYKNPMLLVENRQTIFEANRIKGFEDACRSKKIKTYSTHTFSENKIEKIIEEINSGERDTDSFICSNNIIAFKVLRAIKAQKMSVPMDIGVITFDNYPLAEYMEPALSVVDVDTYKMGETAAELLFKSIRGKEKKIKSMLVSTRIIERDSTKRKN